MKPSLTLRAVPAALALLFSLPSMQLGGLAPVIDKLEDVAEPLREHYKKRDSDGKFVLALTSKPPGYVEEAKLEEFRLNNVKLMNDLEEAKKKRTLTPEEETEYNRLKDVDRQIREKELLAKGDIDALVLERTENMRKDHTAQLKAVEQARDGYKGQLDKANGRLAEVLIDSEVTKAVSQVGAVRKGATQDLIARARQMWRVVDGNPIAMLGEAPVFGKDGKSHLTFPEWAAQVFEEAPYLFEASSGSGAHNNGKPPPTGKQGTIIAGDAVEFGKNLEKIAKGEVKVVQPS